MGFLGKKVDFWVIFWGFSGFWGVFGPFFGRFSPHTKGVRISKMGQKPDFPDPRILGVMGPILGPNPVDFWVDFGVDFGVTKVGGFVIVCALKKIKRKQWVLGPMTGRKK